MYVQSRFVMSVRGPGFAPTTAARVESGVTGFMNAAFGFLFFFAAFFFLAAMVSPMEW
jgi:hypothetical protein